MAKGKSAEWRTEDGLLLLRGWARDGLTDEQIYKNMGIGKTAFYDYLKKYTDIANAIKKGRAPVIETIVDSAYKSAQGYYVIEEDRTITVDKNGEPIERIIQHKRWVKPEPALICYLLNNRKPQQYTNRPEPQTDTETLQKATEILGGVKSVID